MHFHLIASSLKMPKYLPGLPMRPIGLSQIRQPLTTKRYNQALLQHVRAFLAPVYTTVELSPTGQLCGTKDGQTTVHYICKYHGRTECYRTCKNTSLKCDLLWCGFRTNTSEVMRLHQLSHTAHYMLQRNTLEARRLYAMKLVKVGDQLIRKREAMKASTAQAVINLNAFRNEEQAALISKVEFLKAEMNAALTLYVKERVAETARLRSTYCDHSNQMKQIDEFVAEHRTLVQQAWARHRHEEILHQQKEVEYDTMAQECRAQLAKTEEKQTALFNLHMQLEEKKSEIMAQHAETMSRVEMEHRERVKRIGGGRGAEQDDIMPGVKALMSLKHLKIRNA